MLYREEFFDCYSIDNKLFVLGKKRLLNTMIIIINYHKN